MWRAFDHCHAEPDGSQTAIYVFIPIAEKVPTQSPSIGEEELTGSSRADVRYLLLTGMAHGQWRRSRYNTEEVGERAGCGYDRHVLLTTLNPAVDLEFVDRAVKVRTVATMAT